MRTTAATTALLAGLLVSALTVVTGCHADPHDTHISSPITLPH